MPLKIYFLFYCPLQLFKNGPRKIENLKIKWPRPKVRFDEKNGRTKMSWWTGENGKGHLVFVQNVNNLK